MSSLETTAPASCSVSPGRAWLRALDLTAPIARNRDRILSTVIEERAAQLGETLTPLLDRECMTYVEEAESMAETEGLSGAPYPPAFLFGDAG